MRDANAISDEHNEILSLWKKVLKQKSSGVNFRTRNRRERAEKIKKGVKDFLDQPSKEIFKDFWNELDAAQQASTAERVYRNNKPEELQKILGEMEESAAFKDSWQDLSHAKKVLWELFAYLHFDDNTSIPPINTCSQNGLEFFDISTKDNYDDIFEKLKEFSENIYLKKVGHASKNTDHEIPVLFEVDQLFNVVDKAKEDDINKTDDLLEKELYEKILRVKKEDKTADLSVESGSTNFWKISPGSGAFKWDEFREGNYIAIGWDEIDYPEKDIREQIEEKGLDFDKKYVEDQFAYFDDKMEQDDIVFAYGSKTILGVGKIESGYYKEESAEGFKNRRKVKWLDVPEFPAEEIGSEFYENISINQTIVPIENQKFIKKIKGKISGLNVENRTSLPSLDLSKDFTINDLYFPPKEASRLKSQISSAIENGKYIILIGPPGTGKSKLAKEICSSYVEDNYQMVTANSDWSTFDTIGGYHPEGEGSLRFQPGIFLESFKDNATNDPKNQWLILDEINRADIDKAFGALFSALTGDEINLSFKADNGKSIVVRPQEDGEESVKPTDHEHIIPNDWRLIATMNTYDKTSLYEMSYAFMRRFAFIPVPAPKEETIDHQLVEKYLDIWGIDDRKFSEPVADLWGVINRFRKVGPATIEDIYKTLLKTTNGALNTNLDYSSALIMHVLPQFEGLLEEDITDFIKNLDALSSDVEEFGQDDVREISDFAAEYFQINREKLPGTKEGE